MLSQKLDEMETMLQTPPTEIECAELLNVVNAVSIDMGMILRRLLWERDYLKQRNRNDAEDWVELATYIRKRAADYLPPMNIWGDSYFVPPLEDIVDGLIAVIEETAERRSETLAMCAELEADARRYRFIKKHCDPGDLQMPIVFIYPDDMDKTLDEAMGDQEDIQQGW